MEVKIESDTKGGYPFFTYDGPINEPDLVKMGQMIYEACTAADSKGAIVDCKGMAGAMTTAELFHATQNFMKAVGLGIKVAYINPPDHWDAEVDRFSRNVAQNRGGLLELFSTAELAIDWLKD